MAENGLSTRRKFLKAATPALALALVPASTDEHRNDFSNAVLWLVGEFWHHASAMTEWDAARYRKMLALAEAAALLPCDEMRMRARATIAEWRGANNGFICMLPAETRTALRGDAV